MLLWTQLTPWGNLLSHNRNVDPEHSGLSHLKLFVQIYAQAAIIEGVGRFNGDVDEDLA